MRFQKTKIVLSILIIFIVAACSSVKKIPPGEYLLTKNKFEFKEKNEVFKSELPNYVKQKPNSSFLGFLPLKLLLYNSVNPKFDTTFIEYSDLSKRRKSQNSLDSLLIKN